MYYLNEFISACFGGRTGEEMKTVKNKIAGALAVGMLALNLSGCAENQIPEISGSEMALVKDYVAMTMMKYNMGRSSRLVDLSKYSDVLPTPNAPADKPQGMPPVDDTPVIDPSGTGQPDAPETEDKPYRLEEVLALPEGVTVAFQGQEICDSYPEEDEAFYMGATEGKKLLVLRFELSNTGSEEQQIGMLFPDVVFHVTVNGEYTRKALTTGLLDDLLTFEGILPGESSMETVLVIEVDSGMEGTISSVALDVQKELNVYHFELL